jgi:hypothetical protein
MTKDRKQGHEIITKSYLMEEFKDGTPKRETLRDSVFPSPHTISIYRPPLNLLKIHPLVLMPIAVLSQQRIIVL